MSRWSTLPIELALLAFLAVFLLYPLVYVIPGSASDEAYQVRLLSLGETSESRAKVVTVLNKLQLGNLHLHLPYTVPTLPSERGAEMLARELQEAGAEVEVERHRQWTTFYFRQVLGFTVARTAGFPYFQLSPKSPFLWE